MRIFKTLGQFILTKNRLLKEQELTLIFKDKKRN